MTKILANDPLRDDNCQLDASRLFMIADRRIELRWKIEKLAFSQDRDFMKRFFLSASFGADFEACVKTCVSLLLLYPA